MSQGSMLWGGWTPNSDGGYGYVSEYPIQRAWRAARLGPIGGGTNEIMHEIIAKELDL